MGIVRARGKFQKTASHVIGHSYVREIIEKRQVHGI
jgi:hypothetical protein